MTIQIADPYVPPLPPAPPHTLVKQSIPDWLTSRPETLPQPSYNLSNKESYPSIFESVIARLCGGEMLSQILCDDGRPLVHVHFMQWVLRDGERKSRYYEALEMAGEMLFGELLHIADADDSMEDVARSTLRINTRKYYLGVSNRKRFGDVKQIEQNVSVNIVDAMRKAEERVNMIDVTPVNSDEE